MTKTIRERYEELYTIGQEVQRDMQALKTRSDSLNGQMSELRKDCCAIVGITFLQASQLPMRALVEWAELKVSKHDD